MIRRVDDYSGLFTFKVFDDRQSASKAAGKNKRAFLYAIEICNGEFVKLGCSVNIRRRLIDHNSKRGQFRGLCGRVGLLEIDCDECTLHEIEGRLHNTLNRSIIKVGCHKDSAYETYKFLQLGYPDNAFDAFVDYIFPDLVTFLATKNGQQ